MKLDSRSYLNLLRYYYKIKSDLINPANPHTVLLHYRTLCRNKKIAMPLGLRVQDMIEWYELRKIFVRPSFSYRVLNIITPTYGITSPDVNFELNQFTKLTTPSICYVQLYARLIDNEYREFSQFFTDGSKKERGVGAAVVWASLP